MKDPIWKKVSKEAKSLIKEMLHLDPAKRLNATQVLDHAWFKMNFNDSLTILKEVSIDFNQRKSKKL